MTNFTMESTSLMHGDSNKYDLVGEITKNSIKFTADVDMTLEWTDNTVNISNGLNLELGKTLDSKITTPQGDINFGSKLTELSITDSNILFVYEVIIGEEIQEIRKIEYRW